MKKFLPVLLLILAFTGFLTGQIAFDLMDTTASLSNINQKQGLKFQNLYKDLAFENSFKEKVKLGNVKSPIVILNFWAHWCLPCLKEIPSLVELQERFPKEKVRIIGINNDQIKDRKKASKVLERYGAKFEQVWDPDGRITGLFDINAIPYSIIFVNGEVYKISNETEDFSEKSLLNHFKKVLKKSAKLQKNSVPKNS